MMKHITYPLITIVTLVLSFNAFAQQNSKRATPVIVSPVIKGDFADKVEALGTTKANETVMITADRSEKIIQIHFEDGQQVKQGDLLVTLDKYQEEAELRASEVLTENRQRAYNRAKVLGGNKLLSEATLEEREAELKQSQAATEALKARLKSYQITAPFDGILGLREMSIGTLVQPGDRITTIDDLSQIKVDFDVPSVFLAILKSGLPITGYVEAFGDRQFKGIVKTVNTQVDPITRTVKVRAIMPNQDGVLKPGLLMNIHLFKNPRQTLLIPEEALIKRGEKNFVFVVIREQEKQSQEKIIAQQKEIILGARQPGVIEVLSGLNEGDKIVTHGTLKLRDGVEITLRAEEIENESLDSLLKQKAGS